MKPDTATSALAALEAEAAAAAKRLDEAKADIARQEREAKAAAERTKHLNARVAAYSALLPTVQAISAELTRRRVEHTVREWTNEQIVSADSWAVRFPSIAGLKGCDCHYDTYRTPAFKVSPHSNGPARNYRKRDNGAFNVTGIAEAIAEITKAATDREVARVAAESNRMNSAALATQLKAEFGLSEYSDRVRPTEWDGSKVSVQISGSFTPEQARILLAACDAAGLRK